MDAGLNIRTTSQVDTSDLTQHRRRKGNLAPVWNSDAALEWYYKKQEAEMNQRYALEMAGVQNESQYEQWLRENAYNDPAAVRARYEAAGVNGRAVFSEGSANGAGIAGSATMQGASPGSASGSYDKSDTSQSFERASQIAGLVQQGVGVANDVMNTLSQVKTGKSQRALLESQTRSQNYDNEFLKPLERAIKQSLSSSALSESQIKKYQSEWEPYFLQLRSIYEEGNIALLETKRESILEEIENSKSYRALNEEQRKAVIASIQETFARTTRYAYQNALDDALTNLYYAQKDTAETQADLNRAMKGTQEQQVEYLKKQVDLIGSQMKLNEAQIEKWQKEIEHMWARFGTDVFFQTSAEVRNWVSLFMPFGKRNPIGFGG